MCRFVFLLACMLAVALVVLGVAQAASTRLSPLVPHRNWPTVRTSARL